MKTWIMTGTVVRRCLVFGILLIGSASPAEPVEKSASSQFIFIDGEVLLPHRLPWTNGVTLTNIVTLAGGFTDFADRERIEVCSASRTQVCSYGMAVKTPVKNIFLSPGDRVYVPRNRMRDAAQGLLLRMGIRANLPPPGGKGRFIFCEGAVSKPGRIPWTNTMTLSVAVKISGGLTDSADPTRLEIRHENAGVHLVNYYDATNSPSKDFVLSAGDRIVVARRKPEK